MKNSGLTSGGVVVLGGILFVLVLILLAVLYALGGWLFSLAWNFVVPLFWHTAPHLTWLHGVAIGWLVGLVKGLFSISIQHKE